MTMEPEVFWFSDKYERWDDANLQAYLVSLAFSETMGLPYELDFFVYVYDKNPDSPNYGEYNGYTTPGKISIFLPRRKAGLHVTALAHELLHLYEHEVLGIPYEVAQPNFTSKNEQIHFTTYKMDDASLIIQECQNRATSYIMEAPPPIESELVWTHSQS